MPSKYDKILPGLKPLPVADLNYQDKVQRVKEEIGSQDAATLASLYVDLCVEDAKVKEQQYAVNLRFTALEQLLADSQESGEGGWGQYGASHDMLRLVDGGSVQVRLEPYAQVRDKEEFRLWCIANGYERQLQLWPATTNAVAKERLLAGEPLPDGCDVFAKTKVVYTKAKVKKT